MNEAERDAVIRVRGLVNQFGTQVVHENLDLDVYRGEVLGIVGGIFVVEALSVIIQVLYFKRTGKRVFLMAPIHHHYEKKGWAEPTIVIRFWIISLILALIGLATLKLR